MTTKKKEPGGTLVGENAAKPAAQKRRYGPVPAPELGLDDVETRRLPKSEQTEPAKPEPAKPAPVKPEPPKPAPAPPAPPLALWAVLDGARDARIFDIVHTTSGPFTCLFAGKLAPELARAAPWLVRLDAESPVRHVVLREAWGKSWGVLVRASAELETLRKHFRRFLRVQMPDDSISLFRWYDPRVLRGYLPSCNARELELVFGPVASFVVETDSGAAREMRLDKDSGKLQDTTTTLRAIMSLERGRAGV